MSIRNSILNIINGAPVALAQLYKSIGSLEHSIRARVYELIDDGAIRRIGKGIYVKAGQAGIKADSRQALKALAAGGARYDFIVFDLPYSSDGTVGRNRLISDFPTLSPAEIADVAADCAKLLKTETSPLLFIFSNGPSSAKARKEYQAAVERHLKPAASGDYTKVYANGSRCQMMGRLIPTEGLILYSRSGRIDHEVDLDITAIRPPVGGYATRKPDSLLQRILSQVAAAGAAVLDPFAGSGWTARVCQSLGMSSFNIDIQHNPLDQWLIQ